MSPTWSLSAENGHFEVAEIRAQKLFLLLWQKSKWKKISVCKCETILPFDLDFVFAILVSSGNVCLLVLKRLGLISAPDISARDILARTFHLRDISARACFGPTDIPNANFFLSHSQMDIFLPF